MGTIRLALRILAMAAGLAACVPLHYGSRLLFGRSQWPRRFLWWVGRCAGLRVRIVGRPLRSDVLFLANHLSWLDIMIVAGASNAAFVSRGDVARWPVAGRLARMHRTVFVDRGDRRSVPRQIEALRSALASGLPVALFPEGTTEGGTDILPFRPSLLSAIFPPLPDILVQPVAIDYGAAARDIAWVGDESAPANAKRVLSRRGATPVTIAFLEPIDPERVRDRKVLAELARAEIVAALDPSAGASDPLCARR